MNSEVDFAAGGIVLINNKILLVKNKLSDEYKNKALTITGQQSIKISDMLAMLFEILGKKINVKYQKNEINTSHYGYTPYRYKPKSSMKMVPIEYVDLGQGLLDIIEDVYKVK